MPRCIVAVFVIASLPIMVASCDDGSSPFDSKTPCEPGETQECNCSGTAVGEQECVEDGSGWGPCDCGPDTDVDSDSDSDSDTDSDSDSDTDSDTECDELATAISLEHVRMVVLQDMSASMSASWSWTRAGIASWIGDYSSVYVDFGFDVFPDVYSSGSATECEVSNTIPFAPTTGNEAAVTSYVLATTTIPSGSTPLYCAMERYLSYGFAPGFPLVGHENYLVIISDGPDNCGTECDAGSPADEVVLAQLAAEMLLNGVMTYTVGIGSAYDSVALDAIASAGGTDQPAHFSATIQLQLENALATIANSSVPCDWDVSTAATDNFENFNVYLEGEVVPFDFSCGEDTGWNWIDDSHEGIRLCEDTCKAVVESMPSPDLTATVGCATVTE